MDISAAMLLVMMILPVSYGQPGSCIGRHDCPELREEELGGLDEPSRNGLLAIATGEAVQIISTNTVCLGQGTMKGTYRTVSIVIEYSSGTKETQTTVQADLQCCLNGTWSIPVLTVSPSATLTTPRRTDCTLCTSPPTLGATGLEHCAGK